MKTRKTVRRLIAAVLCLAMVMACLPFMPLNNAFVKASAASPKAAADLTRRAYLDGTYIIRCAGDRNLVLTDSCDGGGNYDQSSIQTKTYVKDNESQIFLLQRDVDSATATDYGVRPINKDSWLNDDSGTTDKINMWNNPSWGGCYNSKYQGNNSLTWTFTRNSDGTYCISSVADTTRCITAASGYSSRVTNQTKNASNSLQKWILEPVCLPDSRLEEDTYALVNRASAAATANATGKDYLTSSAIMCLNNKGGSTSYGNQQQLYPFKTEHIDDGLYYIVERTYDGYYTLTSKIGGRYLRSNGNQAVLGTAADGTPDAAEKWAIMQSSSATAADIPGCSIVNFLDGLYLDTNGDAVAQGTAIVTDRLANTIANSKSKAWYFHPYYENSANLKHRGTYDADTNVYASTFDVNDTVTLPIKLFDYRADGMLFEYAQRGTINEEYLEVTVDGEVRRYIVGNNRAFSFTSGSQYVKASTIYANNAEYLKVSASTQVGVLANAGTVLSNYCNKIGYTLLQTGLSNDYGAGFLQSSLSADGKPVYKPEMVEYIAKALQGSLQITEKNADGTYNYNFVDGEANFYSSNNSSLAEEFRHVLKTNNNVTSLADVALGTYDATLTKHNQVDLLRNFNDVKGYFTTYTDVAFFLLNAVFIEDTYNNYTASTTAGNANYYNNYTGLVLTKVVSEDGREGYIFDSAFTSNVSGNHADIAVAYDAATGTIRNTSAAGKSMLLGVNCQSEEEALKNLVAQYPFLPIRSTDGSAADPLGNQLMTNGANYLDLGVIPGSHTRTFEDGVSDYEGKNFNFVLQSEGSFVYHEADNLFFDFDGDDDVYLFINGQLVMDLGGCHGSSHVSIDVNDYVEWAWQMKEDPAAYAALSDADKARVEAFAIYDGDSVRMNFFYMERHGRGSNMRIFTNIEFSSSEVDVEKTAYQNGNQIAYDGIVSADVPVEYGFTLKNTSNHSLFCLTLEDKDIGVTIDYATGLTVLDSNIVKDAAGGTLDIADLKIFLIKDDGTRIPVPIADYSQNHTQALRRLLSDVPYAGIANVGSNTRGLPAGWSIEVRGIYYILTDAQKEAGVFPNKVTGSGYSGIMLKDGAAYDENGYIDAENLLPSGTYLYDTDAMRIRMVDEPVYYMWRGHDLKVTKEKLYADIQVIQDGDGNLLYPSFDPSKISDTILSNASGRPAEFDGVTLNKANLVFSYNTVGAHTFFLRFTFTDSSTLVVPVQVFVTDVKDEVFVLDYGLAVELYAAGTLFDKDQLIVNNKVTSQYFGITVATPSYGNNVISFTPDADGKIDRGAGAEDPGNQGYGVYTYINNVLTYTPSEFIEGSDTIWVAVRVSEDMVLSQALGQVDINEEVEMYKAITIIPANVVYYEDNFADVNYVGSTTENVIEQLGNLNGTVSLNQSADQNMNYGYDDGAYAADTNVELSHGICTKIPIVDSDNDPLTRDTAATFTFKGTGFELIGRTNAQDSATILIELVYPDGTIDYIPVITEFDHGADGGDEVIYQVPVIRVEGLKYGEYTVNIVGVPAYEWNGAERGDQILTYLYIDGVRIYNPIQGSDYEDYYGDEKGAQFTEMRDLILMGQGAAATYVPGNGVDLTYGDIYITEDRNTDDRYETTVGGLDQLNIVGPNNELYLNAGASGYAVVLYVKPTGNGNPVLQIGVHDIDENAFFGQKGTNRGSSIRIGVNNNGDLAWSEAVSITSGTEQYYSIDITKCPLVGGYYQVVIDVKGFVSFTNVKHNNLVFKTHRTFEPEAVITYLGNQLAIFDRNGNEIAAENFAEYLNLKALSEQLGSDDTLAQAAVTRKNSFA